MDQQDQSRKCKKLGFPRKVEAPIPAPSKEEENEQHDPWENVVHVLNWGNDGED